ncbi:integral membrane protein S linking to the trans Golgi network-domain-containing protein [Zopfochytrium polystomum]|nr:integral membrane protein S linking to the trans Golgi network-domain-containing protein [Zopfochytrium polystomum]
MSYRTSVFDPALVVGQIVCLQSAHYISLSFVVVTLELLTGSRITLNHILHASELRTGTVMGWSLAAAFFLNAAVSAYFLLLIVQRAKLCLDFAATVHFFHLILTSLYSGGVPSSFFWWLVFVGCIVVMALAGEYLCMQRELLPIMVGSKGRGGGAAGSSGGGGGGAGNAIELQRLTREVEEH